jgi:ribonuclease P protein component
MWDDKSRMTISSLKRRSEFLAVSASEERWVRDAVVIQILQKSEDQNFSVRAGFTATKKIGGAVVRNRAKRRLRALYQKYQPFIQKQLLEQKRSADLVLVARRDTATVDFKRLEEQMVYALRKLKLLPKELA